ncbi:MAG TPA: SRPBCC domain-containing protein [Anaerolineales bacterium]|nr:SRPBCC domain-containing protein [Anaerolineales bacterium]
MKSNHNEIEIQSSPERVWEVLTDFGKYPEWNPLLCRAEGKLAIGEKVNLTTKSASNDMKLLCTVTTVEPNRQFSWKFHVILPFLFRAEHFFTIEPINEHGVRFIDREIFNGLLVPLQAKNLETNAKAAMIAMGEALKKRVEN